MDSRESGQSHEEFIDELYSSLLRRPADDRGRAYYVQRLLEGTSRLDVTREIATSGEFFELLCRQAFGPQTGTVLFVDYLMRAHRAAVRKHAPLALRQRRGVPDHGDSACSFWFRSS